MAGVQDVNSEVYRRGILNCRCAEVRAVSSDDLFHDRKPRVVWLTLRRCAFGLTVTRNDPTREYVSTIGFEIYSPGECCFFHEAKQVSGKVPLSYHCAADGHLSGPHLLALVQESGHFSVHIIDDAKWRDSAGFYS